MKKPKPPLFHNRYRIPSARKKGYDYSTNGAYFITICTNHREHFFGTFRQGDIQLSKIGKIAYHFWECIPEYFPFIGLGEWVIMPNHIHGIVMIQNAPCRDAINRVSTGDTINHHVSTGNAINHHVSTGNAINHHVSTGDTKNNLILKNKTTTHLGLKNQSKQGGITGKHNPMLHTNLSTIIRWYKGRTTFEVRKIHPPFVWQNRFHDHIIQNKTEYNHISTYIRNNPQNWERDHYYEDKKSRQPARATGVGSYIKH